MWSIIREYRAVLNEIIRGGSQMFVVCLVGVWQRNFEPVVRVYGTTVPALRTVHTHAHIHCRLWLLRLYHIFPHYLVNATIFRKTLLSTKLLFWFSVQLLSEKFIILSRIHQDIIIIVPKCSSKTPVVCFKILIKHTPDRFAKNLQGQNFTKIRPVGAKLFRVDS